MVDIALLLAVLATLLVVVAVSQPVAVRLKLAPVVLLAVIGVAIGAVSIVVLRSPVTDRFDSVAAGSMKEVALVKSWRFALCVPPPSRSLKKSLASGLVV